MNQFERFEKLAAAARAEPVPSFDVADTVLRRLSRPALPEKAFLIMSFACLASAAVLFAFAINAWLFLADPFMNFLRPLVTVMQ